MIHRINIQCYSEVIFSTNSSICIYNLLRSRYCDDQLFLLESISGPKKDCNKSIVAFDPVFTLKVKDNKLTLVGDEDVIDFICHHDDLADYSHTGNTIILASDQEPVECLRKIESLFEVNYNGATGIISSGFFGYYGYDAVFYFEKMKRSLSGDKGYATIHLTFYRGVIEFDLKSKKTILTINNSPFFSGLDIEEIKKIITMTGNLELVTHYDYNYNARPTVVFEQYEKWFTKAKKHIDIGDVYQIQLGHEIEIESDISPFTVYLRLREFNPSPYMYFFQTSEGVYVIGASPEMFVTLTESGEIVMRPIAGTIRNAEDPIIKENQRKKLLSDEKEKAEHLMLVDLCRNDIAHCSDPYTLEVDKLMITEDYSHVIHIVSNVLGRIKSSLDKYDVMAATFPAGTMTGAPKIRAMEIIEDTESSARGIYAGCVGYFGFNDTLLTALCIRTAIYHNGKYIIRASGGIVEDSTAIGEWNETISKLSSTYFAITDKELICEDFIN